MKHHLTHGDIWDTAIIGGGVVGSAIAFGLAAKGMRVVMLDGADDDLRASTGAFGLLWVQDKGDGRPEFGRWARYSAAAWPAFAETLQRAVGHDISWRQSGGMHICLSEGELAARAALLQRLAQQAPELTFDILDRDAVCRKAGLKPGARVVGASYCRQDGMVRPAGLLGALRAAITERGRLLTSVAVESIEPAPSGHWHLRTTRGIVAARRVVIAAGLDSERLSVPFGIAVPLRPVRGQIMVTEAVDPVFSVPAAGLMQLPDGRFVIGDVHEDAGLDENETMRTITRLSARATTLFPRLGSLRVIGAKAAVRAMPRDGMPIYGESPSHPGLFACSCHGGLLLAPVHAGPLADWIAGDGPSPPPSLMAERFGAPAC